MLLDNSSKGKPGPGAYQDSSSTVLRRNPNYGFGKEGRNGPVLKSNSVGPGSYEHKEVVGRDGPKSSMHSALSYNPREKAAH